MMQEPRRLLVYVAGAYAGDVAANVEEAEQACDALIRSGFHVINSYEMNLNTLSRCDAMYVLNNCRDLEVTNTEMEYAKKLGIPIILEEVHPFKVYVQTECFSLEMRPLKDLGKVIEEMRCIP